MIFKFEQKGGRWYEHSDDPGFWGGHGKDGKDYPEPFCVLFYLQWRINHQMKNDGWYDALMEVLNAKQD